MRLSCGGAMRFQLLSALREAIIQRRTVIRSHRDQKLDDRCWLDDYLVWKMCDDSPVYPLLVLPLEEAMQKCREFSQCRRAEYPDPIPIGAVLEKNLWDKDLNTMTSMQRTNELARIQIAIRRHRDISDRPRTLGDDRLLYSVLPEQIPADFRLPPEEDFLGEAQSPHAGCRAFWKSHGACPRTPHNLHQWGPCK